jgi:hypothetical protein
MRSRIWLLLSLFAACIMWMYVSRVLGPWEHYIDVEHGILRAQLGDLYSPWMGTRELLLRGRNPYGPEVRHEIQTAFYGHVVDQQYADGAKVLDEQRFAYPVYVVFLLGPAVYVDFPQAQIWGAVVLAALAATSVFLWMNVAQWKPPPAMMAALVLFVLSSPQIVQGLRLRQLGVAVGFLLALSAWFIVRNQLALAGVALALSTIKPQMVSLPLLWFLLWSVGAWPKRRSLLTSFGITLALLIGLGELVLPGWPRFFLDGVSAYTKYALMPSLLHMAFGNRLGNLISGVIVASILVYGWRNRSAPEGSRSFTICLAASLMGAILAFPLFTPFNQVLLVLPILLFLRDWKSQPRISRLVFAVATGWPWITCLILLLFPPALHSPNQRPLLPSFLSLFFPLMLPLLLMTTRGDVTFQIPDTDSRLS